MTIRIVDHHNRCLADCLGVIIVPEPALAEAGRIRCLSVDQTGQSKHEFHALGQMALMQFEDGELTVENPGGPLNVILADETLILERTVVICRLQSGHLRVFGTGIDHPVRKYLEAAHRFCTRWIRLDI